MSRRVLAAALSSTFGRFGGLFGNLLFGFLIDGHCLILICTLAAMLLRKKNYSPINYAISTCTYTSLVYILKQHVLKIINFLHIA